MTADRHILAENQSECSHTPGPWEILADPDDRSGWVVVDATHTRFQIASMEPRFRPKEELANARLIAAAPELLQGMKDLYRAYVNLLEAGRDRITTYGGQCDSVETMERGDPWLKQARDVIAKAEGRS